MIRRDENNTFTLKNHTAFALSLAALVMVLISGIASGQSSKRMINQGKKGIVEQVRRYPDSLISFENYEAVPLFIQQAKAKEIGNAEYYQLTGFTTDSSRYVSFPNVTLTNKTDQRVVGFALAFANKQMRKIDGVKLNKISIEPYGSYTVKATDFIRSDRMMRVTEGGKVISRLKPDFDSEKMWLRGSASDMVLIVGMVEFENGTTWMMDSSRDPW